MALVTDLRPDTRTQIPKRTIILIFIFILLLFTFFGMRFHFKEFREYISRIYKLTDICVNCTEKFI